MPRTKIVATIGPACSSLPMAEAMIRAGATVFRLNFSHGTAQDHREYIRTIRRASKRAECEVMILGDLPGPKIRFGEVKDGPLTLNEGQPFFLTTRNMIGTSEGASVSYGALIRDVTVGDTIALNDGSVMLKVESKSANTLNCRVLTSGQINSRKGVNFPKVRLSARSLTTGDRRWIEFATAEGVDVLALSFVREPADVLKAKRAIAAAGGTMPLIAKIEKHEAVDHLEEVLEAADGAMAARGDLGVEMPLELVPAIQKNLLRLCNRMGKPVITATQMLESMMHSARPTRAEVSDVANAILDGSDAVMLSGETAIGEHPLEAVRMMARVAAQTDGNVPQVNWLNEFSARLIDSSDEAISHSVFRVSQRVGASAILCLTISGATARRISRYRPGIPLIALSAREETRRQLQMSWGVTTLGGLDEGFLRKQPVDVILAKAMKLAVRAGMIRDGETVVVAAGIPLWQQGNTNLIRVMQA